MVYKTVILIYHKEYKTKVGIYMASLSAKRFQEKENAKARLKYKLANQDKKDLYLDSDKLIFTVITGSDRNKIVATNEKGFRSFAYFTDNEDKAKTAILMEYKMLGIT